MNQHRLHTTLTAALALTCAGCACDGPPSQHFKQLTASSQLFFRVYQIKQHGAQYAKTGATAVVVDSSDCAVSGKVELDDTGLLRFIDCKMTPDQTVRGGILANDQGFVYQNLISESDGRLSTLNGGYTWTSPDVLTVDITMTYPDFDNGPQITARSRGSLTFKDDKVNGSYDYVTNEDVAAGREGGKCTFVDAPLERLAALLEDNATLNEVCDDGWSLRGACLGSAQHLCDKMPGQSCNTATMENAVNKVKNDCGARFYIPSAEAYCRITPGAAYNVDACLLAGQ